MKCSAFTLSTVLAVLVGCGGGGGGGGSDAAGNSPSAPPSMATQPVLSVPPATYSEKIKQDAFRRTNEIRQQLGLGLVSQNSKIDVAAQAHANYLTDNNAYEHEEIGSNIYGAFPMNRTDKAGYIASEIFEVIVFGVNQTGTGQVDKLMDTFYHRMPFMRYNLVDVGIGESRYQDGSNALVLDFGVPTGSVGQGAPSVPYAIWPRNNSVAPSVEMTREVPDPGGKGYPVMISIDSRKILKVSKFELRESGSTLVPAKVLTGDNDPFIGQYPVAGLLPNDRLKPATSYVVDFEGTSDGAPLSIRSSFTTP